MMMFINPMLMLAAENMIERSFENRNPTLFAIGAGMFGVGAVGWAGTKAFVKKESKAKKPAAKAFRNTSGVSILVILASLLAGLGFGGGAGSGEGDVTTVAPPAESSVETMQDSTQETYAEDFVIRVNKTEIYVNGTLCKDEEAVKALLLSDYKDGNTVLLIDDYADTAAEEAVKDVLNELAISYRATQKQ